MTFIDHAPDRGQGRYRALVVFLGLTLGVGALGGFATSANVQGWYATLNRPDIAPPNWVFGPVWTTLYVLIGVAGWRVWRTAGTWSGPMALFAIQLALNCAWSFIFFGAHQITAALVEIVALLGFIVWTTLVFGRRDRIAGWLFAPYLAWVSFATLLNAAYWRIN
jgi:tryptophan-rich sensory protein